MAVRTRNRPEVKHILRRVSSGLAGVNEAALLKDLLDAMDDRIKELSNREKKEKQYDKALRQRGLF